MVVGGDERMDSEQHKEVLYMRGEQQEEEGRKRVCDDNTEVGEGGTRSDTCGVIREVDDCSD